MYKYGTACIYPWTVATLTDLYIALRSTPNCDENHHNKLDWAIFLILKAVCQIVSSLTTYFIVVWSKLRQQSNMAWWEHTTYHSGKRLQGCCTECISLLILPYYLRKFAESWNKFFQIELICTIHLESVQNSVTDKDWNSAMSIERHLLLTELGTWVTTKSNKVSQPMMRMSSCLDWSKSVCMMFNKLLASNGLHWEN